VIETFFSVDVETSGPVPGIYSLLALGACRVDDPTVEFSAELRPEAAGADPDAIAVSGLSMDRLRAEGEPAAEAMRRFAAWVDIATPGGSRPVFVAFNAPFDWMFVAEALYRHVGRNPFGHAALDVKALAMGVFGLRWRDTSYASLAARVGVTDPLPHRAIDDARLQAEVFRRILAEMTSRGGGP
jgi:DNA polymerase III epsilon subunit-like protein